jgi:glycosyltransferase involved in cell wall biosynthesis
MLCPGATFYRDGNICEDCVEKGLKCALKHKCYRGSLLQTLLCVINTKIHRFTGVYKKINYICLTGFTKEKILMLNKGKRKVIDENKIFIKPNFTFESNYSRLEEGDYYLFIGRVEQIKGLDLLLDAFALLPDKKLRIAGTGTEMEHYKQRATPNVEFLGFLNREELSLQLTKAKAVIVPSQWYETFGMIIAEAYSAHCPVIVGDIGNIASLVEDGVTGVKFKYNDSTALIDAISRFENCEPMGEKGFEKFKNEYSEKVNYKKLKNVYEQIEEYSKL